MFDNKIKALDLLVNNGVIEQQKTIIVGSLALREAGIPLSREVGDIDLLCVKDESRMKIWKVLDHVYGNKVKPYPGGSDMYKFEIGGTKINIWPVEENKWDATLDEESPFTKYGFHFASVKATLQAKMAYKREKDKVDLAEICNNLMKLGF